jgi:hypothetical protein
MNHERKNLKKPEPETLVFHREMYNRRLRRLRQRGGLSEREIAVQVNDPTLFRRQRTGVGTANSSDCLEVEDKAAFL